MPEFTVARRVDELRQQINKHNYAYFVLDDPIIADGQYDILMRELRKIERTHPNLVTSDSPTQRIGAEPAEGFNQVDHPYPMFSLANAFDNDEFLAWHRRILQLTDRTKIDMVCELKFDGLAVSLTYDDGVLIQAATRGNGHVGEDITANVRTIKSVPLRTLKTIPLKFEVRGEILFPKSKFETFNQQRVSEGLPPYSHPRNTASGSVRQLDSQKTATRPLDIFVYSLAYSEWNQVPNSQWEMLHLLRTLGFKTNLNSRKVCTPQEAIEYYQEWTEKHNELDYGCDGVVVKINEFDFHHQLGVSGREPRWAIAYKFPATQSVTTLLDIKVNVGRTGSITPYAILDPVDVNGAVVRQATLHNEDYIKKKDLLINDRVIVERAGEVIPKVVASIPQSRTGKEKTFIFPGKCPSCNNRIGRPEGDSSYICINAQCPAQKVRLLEHFVSRDAMNIGGLGIKQATTLLETGLIKDVADLYTLNRVELLELDRFGPKSADNLLLAIEKSKACQLDRVIAGLGIPLVGREAAELLAHDFGTMEALIKATPESLQNIPGIGFKMSSSIFSYFSTESNLEVIERLNKAGVSMGTKDQSSLPPGVLTGLRFVVTGKLEAFTRREIQTKINDLGGSVASSISKNIDYLVAGTDAGTKLSTAKTLEVEVLSEAAFLLLIDNKQNIQSEK